MKTRMEHSELETIWGSISPMLDDAMGALNSQDRDVLVLRYFLNQTLADVGAAMGIAERDAQKRVTHALEKLRRVLDKRGVAVTANLIAGEMLANSVQAAPSGFIRKITEVAATKGAAAQSSTLAMARETRRLMAWARVKLALTTGVFVVFAAVAITLAIMEFETTYR